MGGAAARKVKPEGLYTSHEAGKVCGIPWRTICYWEKCGLGIAGIQSSGSGTDRWYSVADLVCLYGLAKLGRAGLRVRRIVMNALRFDRGTARLCVPIADVVEITLDMRRIRLEVEQRAKSLRKEDLERHLPKQ